jgi:hypothetical protein
MVWDHAEPAEIAMATAATATASRRLDGMQQDAGRMLRPP